jgi:fibronectin-binding autotransporter adhesin
VLVTGPGSLWTNRGAFSISGGLLLNSSSNQLVVSDGGTLASGGMATLAGFGNRGLVTGPGSRWVSQSDFTFAGNRNFLELRAGAGLLISSNTTFGDIFASGDTNTALLTGAGTAWTNGGDLNIGFSSTKYVLTASNGASVLWGVEFPWEHLAEPISTAFRLPIPGPVGRLLQAFMWAAARRQT